MWMDVLVLRKHMLLVGFISSLHVRGVFLSSTAIASR